MKLSRTVIGAICIALAVAIVFGGTIITSKVADTTVYTVAANSNISDGTVLGSANIKSKRVSESTVTDMQGAIYSKDEDEVLQLAAQYLYGKYASVDMLTGDIITSKKVSTNEITGVSSLIESLESGEVAVALPLPSSSSGQVANQLKVGDIVSIIVTSSEDGTTSIPLRYKYLELVALTTSTGVDIDKAAQNSDGSDPMPAFAVFAMPEAMAIYIRSDLVNGVSYQFVINYRGNDESILEDYRNKRETYETKLIEAAEATAKKRYEEVSSGKKTDFNSYYEEHVTEFIKLIDDVLQYCFETHVDTDTSEIKSAYDEIDVNVSEETTVSEDE